MCGQDTLVDEFFVVYFLWVPIILLIAVSVFKLLKDISLFVFGTLMFSGFYWLLYLIAVLVEEPRPLEVAECDRTFAVPDPNFVVTVAFVLLGIGCWLWFRVATWGNWFNIVGSLLALAGYFTALLRGGYLTWVQFAWNLGASVVTAAAMWGLVWLLFAEWVILLSKHPIARRLGFVDAFLSGNWGPPAAVKKTRLPQ